MELGLIRKVDIESEMQQAYLDYAMSVIVARALPDARDGLKPVQRRVLYAMYDMGIRPDTSYKKSARIVGEVLGKYHPHGDVAVYESMARLAQDFSMRYPLVDGQGNFGSVDGDPPAAMRYTEARMSPFAMEMLAQLERNTVDFTPNFDATLDEPDVLPAAAPNLLVNGASGIAVGMATNIPPHNLNEVVDALVLLLHEWERMDDINISDLMQFIKGPDFPTGGIILEENGQNELLQAYATGRGRVLVRGRVQKEVMERGKSRLIITELPYQVNKSSLIERIAELVRDGVLEGISDLRDESDRHGMRVVIELKGGIDPDPVLRMLFQKTTLESTFGINLLALVGGEPHLLSLKQALRVFLEHRLVIVRRRSEFDLDRAKARAHILEGLRIALANLDEIIALIKAAPDVEQARERLIKRFKLSDLQAQAILDMQLRRLASLERKKIELEYHELESVIKNLEALLKSPKRMRQAVEDELVAVKEKFGDKRRTQIFSLKEGVSSKELLTTNDLTPAHPVWIGIMADGTIGRAHNEELPRISGRVAPRWLLRATTHQTLILCGEDGRAVAVAVESLPEVEKFGEGLPLNKVSPLDAGEPLAAVLALPQRSDMSGEVFIATVSRLGMVKKTAVEELSGPSSQRFVLAKVNSGDALGFVFLMNGSNDFLLVTAQGMAIRFGGQEVRAMGLVAAGVNGIKLGPADRVIGADRFGEGSEALVVNSLGKAWRLTASEFPTQGRYGQGVQIAKLEAGIKLTGMMTGKRMQSGIVHFRSAAAKAIRLDDIANGKRQRSGQDLAPVKTGDMVEAITTVIDSLSFWIKPEAAKKRGQKAGSQEEDLKPIIILEEKQVQVTLPGIEVQPGRDGNDKKAGVKKDKTEPPMRGPDEVKTTGKGLKRRKEMAQSELLALQPEKADPDENQSFSHEAGPASQPATGRSSGAKTEKSAGRKAEKDKSAKPEEAKTSAGGKMPVATRKSKPAPTSSSGPGPVLTEVKPAVRKKNKAPVDPQQPIKDETKSGKPTGQPGSLHKKDPAILPAEAHGWEQVNPESSKETKPKPGPAVKPTKKK